jgi:hypothetical protein
MLTSQNSVEAKFAQRFAPGKREKLQRSWESYGRLLLLHQLL